MKLVEEEGKKTEAEVVFKTTFSYQKGTETPCLVPPFYDLKS